MDSSNTVIVSVMVEKQGNKAAGEKQVRKPWTLREFGGKTIWDWMGLLIVPVVLSLITVVFAWQQDIRQDQIESKRANAERELARERAILEYTDLTSADLSDADLSHASLSKTDLLNANLSDANLSHVYLNQANLDLAHLSDANLNDASGITNEELEQQAASLKGATMPNGQKYEDWIKDKKTKTEGRF